MHFLTSFQWLSNYATGPWEVQVRWDRNQSLGQTPDKPEHWMLSPFFCFCLKEETWYGSFPLGCTMLCQVGAGTKMCVQNSVNFPTHFVCIPSYFYGIWVAVVSHLVFRVLTKIFWSIYFFWGSGLYWDMDGNWSTWSKWEYVEWEAGLIKTLKNTNIEEVDKRKVRGNI